MKIVVVSGGFDPIHSGHIAYFSSASLLGDRLVVALNSDNWLVRKKGKTFMPFNERKIIIESLNMVDDVIDFEDDHNGSCINALKKVQKLFPSDEIIFCNGGDRSKENCPEMQLKNINFVFGVGGNNKKNSSSWILKNWNYHREDRIWGEFYNLFEDNGRTAIKVKEFIINPGKGLSFQRHFLRNELWLISKGGCYVNFSKTKPNKAQRINLVTGDHIHLPLGSWHQAVNVNNKPCHVIEIQYGEKTEEEDIERLSYYENN